MHKTEANPPVSSCNHFLKVCIGEQATMDWCTCHLLPAITGCLTMYILASTLHQCCRLRHVPGLFLVRFSYQWLLFVAPSSKEPYIY